MATPNGGMRSEFSFSSLPDAVKMGGLKLQDQIGLGGATRPTGRLMSYIGKPLFEISESVEPISPPASMVESTKDDVMVDKPVSSQTSAEFYNEKPPSRDELENTCRVALEVVFSLSLCGHDMQGLNEYTKKLFKLPEAKIAELEKQVQQQSNPDLKLICNVVSAEGLDSKDANGKSDPYCRLAILPRRHQSADAVKTHNLVDWHKAQLVGEVVQTSIQIATLSPVWNQKFELPITDPKEELLVVEVWDSDDRATGSKKIRGLKGFGNFLQDQFHKKDDFLGRSFYLLQAVPFEGETCSLPLKSHSGKHTHGSVTLWMEVKGLREEVPESRALREHAELFHIIINTESRDEFNHYCRHWSGVTSSEAERLLLHHASIANMNPLQQAAVRLQVFMQYHRSFAVDMTIFVQLLQWIKRSRRLLPSLLPGADGACKLNGTSAQWLSQLFKDLEELWTYILDVLRNHIMVIDFKKDSGLDMLRQHLIALRELYAFEPFVVGLTHQDKATFKETVGGCIQVAVPRWYLVLSSKSLPMVNTPEEQLSAFRGLCQHLLNQCQRSLDTIVPVFREFDIDYFSLFYRALDQQIYGEVPRLVVFDNENDSVTFEIFLLFRQIEEMSHRLLKHHQKTLRIQHYHEWFVPMVVNWIGIAAQRCKDRIRKAIDLDEAMETVSDTVRFSTSVVDAEAILEQLLSFFLDLHWPIPSEAYSYAITLTNYITEAAMVYIEALFTTKLLGGEEHVNHSFCATEKLCIVLNNMEHMRTTLCRFREHEAFQKYCQWLTEATAAENGGREERGRQGEKLGDQLKAKLSDLIENATEDIANRTRQLTEQILQRLSPDIERLINEKLVAAGEDTAVEEAIAPLIDYLSSNLQTLGDYLLTPVFWGLLSEVWTVNLRALQRSLAVVPQKTGNHYLYQRLYAGLRLLQEFYYADGKGISKENLKPDCFKSLFHDLTTLRLPTPELALSYNHDLADCQAAATASGETELGSLRVSVGHLRDKEMLEIHIFQGMKLPALDRNGLSDPFVELVMQPEARFEACSDQVFKTHVMKATLDPVFDQEFLLPVTNYELNEPGSVLILVVFDYDQFSSNDLAGICVIAAKDIPRLPGGAFDDPTAPQRKIMLLPVIMPPATTALKELELRSKSGDSVASDFWKSHKKYLTKPGHRSSIVPKFPLTLGF